MKKVFLLLSLMGLSVLVTSCGSKNDDPNRLGLGQGGNPDSNLESLQIRQKYGIQQDADLAAHLRSVEIDLNDSGLFFDDSETPYSDQPVYKGKNISEKRIASKKKRALKRGRYGKAPKGIEWEKTQDKCNDLVVTLDNAPEGSYEAESRAHVLREYYEVSKLYLNKTFQNTENCYEYKKIEQSHQQIARLHMKSASTTGNSETVITQGVNAGGTGTRTRVPYGDVEAN